MTTPLSLPGLQAGTWEIDTAHSEVSFTVRHMTVAKVRGVFDTVSGTIEIADHALLSSVNATIDANTMSTRDEGRDAHVRSADFLDVENHPHLTFVSKSVEHKGDDFLVRGDLTIKGTTREVVLDLEFNGAVEDPNMGTKAGFSASTEISRAEFGVSFNAPLANGGFIVSDKVKVELEIEATHKG
jgi:polyisoprenoid-binding protein YceI